MNIALIGYGKMGKMIESIALRHGHTIVVRLTSAQWDAQALQNADVCMEFTCAGSVLNNVKKVAEAKKKLVIGTTGWDDHFELIRSVVNENHIGAVYSPNFSIGINLLFEMLDHASKVMHAFPEYDVAGIDSHHKEKRDLPSGTALKIAKTLKENLQREVPFTSIRCGSTPGKHTVLFDSPHDTITITHEARNREGFAQGALQAAEWLRGKTGFYAFAECLRQGIKR